jgi:RNA polymerase sigma-70 factor, ECF subfamily
MPTTRPIDNVNAAILERPLAVPFEEDALLVERFVAGDEQAFRDLYLKYYDKVYSIVRGILLEHEDALDVAQEVFTLVYRNGARFNKQSKFTTWLFRIAVNRAIQESRSSRHRNRSLELADEVVGMQPSPEVTMRDPAVFKALSKLQPADRAAIVLFYWEEQSLTEIGYNLGCSTNAAKTRLYRARDRFKVAYEEEA